MSQADWASLFKIKELRSVLGKFLRPNYLQILCLLVRGLELQSIPLLKGFNVEDVPDIIEFIYKGNTSTWNLGTTLEKLDKKY